MPGSDLAEALQAPREARSEPAGKVPQLVDTVEEETFYPSTASTLLVVGQAPGPGERPCVLPFWDSSSLRRLAGYAGVDPPHALYERATFVNLVSYHPGRWQHGDAFPLEHGRECARVVWEIAGVAHWNRVLVLGSLPAKAMGLRKYAALEWHRIAYSFPSERHLDVAWSPHPSGRSKWWNDPENRSAGERFLREAFS